MIIEEEAGAVVFWQWLFDKV